MNSNQIFGGGKAEWSARRIGLCATQLFLYCFLAYTCSYLGRKNFSACIPAMIEEGFLTKTFGGTVNSAYMLIYGAGQILNGIVGTKIKPRFMIGTGLCGAGLCNLAMGFVPSAQIMPLIWAMNGLFHSMLWAPFSISSRSRRMVISVTKSVFESSATDMLPFCCRSAIISFCRSITVSSSCMVFVRKCLIMNIPNIY